MYNWYMFVISAWTTITTTCKKNNSNEQQSQLHGNCSVAIREIACIKCAITARQQFFVAFIILFACCFCCCVHIYMHCMQFSRSMSPHCRCMRLPQHTTGTHDFHNKHSKTQKSKTAIRKKRGALATCDLGQ